MRTVRGRTDRLFPIAVLALLAMLTLWLERATRVEEEDPGKRLRRVPDYIVEKFASRRFGEGGAPRYSLSADRMVHYTFDESTEVTRPHITYHARIPLMHLTADTAMLSKNADVVELSGNVVARREAAANRPELRLVTDRMTVYPDEEIANTESDVRITQGGSVITGRGLEADNRKSTLVLKSDVRAVIQSRPGQR